MIRGQILCTKLITSYTRGHLVSHVHQSVNNGVSVYEKLHCTVSITATREISITVLISLTDEADKLVSTQTASEAEPEADGATDTERTDNTSKLH